MTFVRVGYPHYLNDGMTPPEFNVRGCYAKIAPHPCPSPKIGGGEISENDVEAVPKHSFNIIFGSYQK